MASSGRRRFSVRHPVVVDVGCSCRRTKLSNLFSSSSSSSSAPSKPKPNPYAPPKHRHPLSSYYPFSPSASVSTTTFSTTTISPWETSHHPSSSSTSATSLYEDSSSSPVWKPKPPPPAKKKSATTTHIGKKAAAAAEKGRVAKESVAVVKESEDPYHDFRNSMLQMIVEKEIYASDDLRELLHRFLSLNSPYHHDSILRAFTEIWNGVFSATTTAPTAPRRRKHGGHPHSRRLS